MEKNKTIINAEMQIENKSKYVSSWYNLIYFVVIDRSPKNSDQIVYSAFLNADSTRNSFKLK